MQYEIGEVEYPEHHADGAYVKSIWRERFDDGEDRFDVTWVLRKQPEGWRIVGMAMSLPGSEEPDLTAMLHFAAKVAALNCTRYGAQAGLPRPADLGLPPESRV